MPAVILLYRKANEEFGDVFRQTVMHDMRQVDYDIEDIGIMPPVSIRVDGNLPGELIALYVKERELAGFTDQHSMSQGMFRVLSMLIHLIDCGGDEAVKTRIIEEHENLTRSGYVRIYAAMYMELQNKIRYLQRLIADIDAFLT